MKKFARFTMFTLLVLCIVLVASVSASAVKLKDIDNHWAKSYIEYGVEQGYISGYEDGTFLPDKAVTRAEFSKMINNAIKLTSYGTAKGNFTDVDTGEWYFNEVRKAEYAGYIAGYEDGSFKPYNNITRQEAAVILSRIVLPTEERANINSFKDAGTIDTWAKDAVCVIAAKGYIKGDQNENFLPKGALTRSQAAKLICEFVKNENIQNKNQNVNSDEKDVVFSETIFTDNVVVNVENGTNVVFKNCRILGNLTIASEGAIVDLETTAVKEITFSKSGTEMTLDKSSSVNTANIMNPVAIVGDGIKTAIIDGDDLSSDTVALRGLVETIEVNSDALITLNQADKLNVNKKVNLVIQSGTVKQLTVETAAKNSSINLATSKVDIENATNKAAVKYYGKGTIEKCHNDVDGVEFDGVTVEEITGKKAEGESTASSKFFDGMTVTPSKGKTGVSVTSNISLVFDNKIFNKDGNAVDAEYLEENIELRRTSANGTATSFTAKIASSKSITLSPNSSLKNGTKYYVVIPKGIFTNSDGDTNDEYTTYFTTITSSGEEDSSKEDEEDNSDVTMSPKNGAEDVSVSTTIKLTFAGTLKAYSSSDVFDEEYVEDEAIKIYEDSTSGDEVSFSASISGKTVTLTPSSLLGGTKYYVVILSNKIKVGGTALSKTTMSFTTEDGVPIKISPENGATGISTYPEISVSFSEPVLQTNKNHDALTEDYIQDEVILFRKSSATKTDDEYQVSYSISEIAENGRKFTIVPDVELESGTTYYIVVKDESLYGKTSGMENEKVTSSFKTASVMAPMFYPVDGKKNVSLSTEIRISFSDELLTYSTKKDERVPVTDEYLDILVNGDEDGKNKNKISLKRGSTILDITATIDSDGKTIIITPDKALQEEKTYTISISDKVFYSGAGKYNSKGSASFNTNEALSPTFTPKNDADGVAVTVNPTIKFSEKIYSVDEENRTLKPNYLKSAITFVDEYGNDVEFTASADDTTITIEPEKDLDGNVEYTITLLAGKITNEEGVVSNAEKSVSFTTKVSYTITIEPENKKTSVSPLVNPTVRFGTEVFTVDDDPVDADYAYDYIFISVGKTASSVDASHVIPTTIEVGDDGRTFTIIPDEGLEFETKYYINVLKNGFHYDDGKANSSASAYFTTIDEPSLSKVKISSTAKNSVKIGFTSNVKGKIVVENEEGTVVGEKDLRSAGSSSVEIKGLTEGTEYNFSIYVVYEEEIESEAVEISATTKS